MTTIISRKFPDEAAAKGAVDRLIFKGVPSRQLQIITKGSDAHHQMERAQVHASAMDAYAKALEAGHAVFVAQTTYKPLGAAGLVRDVLAARGAIDTPGVTEDYFVRNMPDKAGSILKDHPRFLTLPPELDAMVPRGRVSAPVMKMTTTPRTKRSVISGGRFMSRAFWPMPLLSRKTRRNKVISGGRQVSRAIWPMPLLSDKPRRKSVIPGGGFPLSRRLGWPTVS